ncbi:MAG: hypothetical protein V2I56_01915 [Desulfobacteraceae bacterium]|jgi:hypothetical protein|nr:hypothetical protein [Desulfobacteraceae bacterium]
MEALISLLGLLLFFAIGAFSIYLVIDFIEYLKKYHSERWAQLSFETLFGISQQDLFFYQIQPLKFIPYLFNKEDSDDAHVAVYKKRIQLSLLGVTAMFVIYFLISRISV